LYRPSVGFSLFIFSPLLLIILIFISYEERWTPDIEGYNLRTIEFVEHKPLRAACFENIFLMRFVGKLFLLSVDTHVLYTMQIFLLLNSKIKICELLINIDYN